MSTTSCPRCTGQVTLPAGISDEATVRCPLCHAQYSLADALAGAPPMLEVVEETAQVTDGTGSDLASADDGLLATEGVTGPEAEPLEFEQPPEDIAGVLPLGENGAGDEIEFEAQEADDGVAQQADAEFEEPQAAEESAASADEEAPAIDFGDELSPETAQAETLEFGAVDPDDLSDEIKFDEAAPSEAGEAEAATLDFNAEPGDAEEDVQFDLDSAQQTASGGDATIEFDNSEGVEFDEAPQEAAAEEPSELGEFGDFQVEPTGEGDEIPLDVPDEPVAASPTDEEEESSGKKKKKKKKKAKATGGKPKGSPLVRVGLPLIIAVPLALYGAMWAGYDFIGLGQFLPAMMVPAKPNAGAQAQRGFSPPKSSGDSGALTDAPAIDDSTDDAADAPAVDDLPAEEPPALQPDVSGTPADETAAPAEPAADPADAPSEPTDNPFGELTEPETTPVEDTDTAPADDPLATPDTAAPPAEDTAPSLDAAPADDPFAEETPEPAPEAMPDEATETPPADDPFAEPATSPTPADDPFAEPATPTTPADDPFAEPATSPTPADDPFAEPAAAAEEMPAEEAAPTDDPFASPATPDAPPAEPGAQPDPTPAAPADVDDPFATEATDAPAEPAADDPFAPSPAALPTESPRNELPAPADAAQPSEPLGPRNVVPVTPAEVDRALQATMAAGQTMAAAEAAGDPAGLSKARMNFYVSLYDMANAMTLGRLGPGAGQLDPRVMAPMIREQLAADPKRLEMVKVFGARWFASPKRTNNGVVLAGTVEGVDLAGRLYHTRVKPGASDPPVTLVSSEDPQVTTGDEVLTLGSIIENPADAVAGYEGSEPAVIWSGMTMKITPDGQ